MRTLLISDCYAFCILHFDCVIDLRRFVHFLAVRGDRGGGIVQTDAGRIVGVNVGAVVGRLVGVNVGAVVGFDVGVNVGSVVGRLVGVNVGAVVGINVGVNVGEVVGIDVGAVSAII